MHMEVAGLDLHIIAFQWGLMNAHTIWELCFEQVVIASRHLRDGFCKQFFFLIIEIDKSSFVLLGQDHDLEGPHRPPRAQRNECGVFEDDSFLLFMFECRVVFKQIASTLFTSVFLQLVEFESRFFGQACAGPNLPVGMRIRTSHRRAFVLEYLHPAVLRIGFCDICMLAGRRQGRCRC